MKRRLSIDSAREITDKPKIVTGRGKKYRPKEI